MIWPFALRRKIYLFAGSHDGTYRASIICSLLVTAKKHDVEPFAYLKEVTARIGDFPLKLKPKSIGPVPF